MIKILILILSLTSFFCFSDTLDTLDFKVENVEPNSLFAKINLKPGDTIKKIDGKDIKNLDDITNFFSHTDSVKSLLVIKDGKMEEINL